ncbi:hypothetical protein Asulf_01491 [Archaeoglobus sulfaticallidus PM70-1]|uniref:Uncharacterized protein n=1 Tax=Archaeoglobus sulfaticallidus PM70-1 TaxID=387631 RepID=N0BCY9_9EURY|nr:DUF6011 domain-containing protein [Archaeoglobus sulfaticallidus]AGK61474.1 hypothetical protein Asulf_01491 [Archaeoglobus sulfaticallidus PM70-1]
MTVRCGICGKPLSNPDSVRKGIGPKCAQKLRSADFRSQMEERIQKLRLKAHREYNKNLKKYPILQEGEVRCKNCGRPVYYHPDDGCPGPFCCSPCCPYATISPCPREQKMGSLVDALAVANKQATLEV